MDGQFKKCGIHGLDCPTEGSGLTLHSHDDLSIDESEREYFCEDACFIGACAKGKPMKYMLVQQNKDPNATESLILLGPRSAKMFRGCDAEFVVVMADLHDPYAQIPPADRDELAPCLINAKMGEVKGSADVPGGPNKPMSLESRFFSLSALALGFLSGYVTWTSLRHQP